MSLGKDFTKGIWRENPVLIMLLGMCPALAVTSNAENGLSMGIATTFVLLGCNIVISLIRDLVPRKIRIPVYIVVIASFVTLVELLMKAYAPPAINKSLGIFIPLIVVNCIVLGRAEAFASRNGPLRSIMDALGMGVGFALALTALGGAREFLATGSLFQIKLIIPWKIDFMLWTGAPGAFIILGCFLAGMNKLNMRRAVRNGEVYIPPQGLDCRHCRLCEFNSTEEEIN